MVRRPSRLGVQQLEEGLHVVRRRDDVHPVRVLHQRRRAQLARHRRRPDAVCGGAARLRLPPPDVALGVASAALLDTQDAVSVERAPRAELGQPKQLDRRRRGERRRRRCVDRRVGGGRRRRETPQHWPGRAVGQQQRRRRWHHLPSSRRRRQQQPRPRSRVAPELEGAQAPLDGVLLRMHMHTRMSVRRRARGRAGRFFLLKFSNLRCRM